MIDKINLWLARLSSLVAGVAIVLMTVVAFVDVIGRKLNHPLDGAEEYVSLMLLVFFFAALPLVVRDDSHIRVGLLSDLYGSLATRIEKYFTAVVELLSLGVLTYMIFDQADRLARFGTLSVHFLLPMAPWVLVAALFTAVATWFMAQVTATILRGREVQSPSHHDKAE